ncbi:hypothetical protein BBJ28_00019995 [Nothophytophthora sp. Chile5]|nr:hypothetical protein BBJ28_00019995 [Nothophytophthora sp. Chile5]
MNPASVPNLPLATQAHTAFAMATHLAHRIPWTSLSDLLKKHAHTSRDYSGRKLQPEHKEKLKHFARCLRDALLEFKESDKSTDEEKRKFDPNTWGVYSWSAQGMMGYYQSLASGYCELNLILSDPEAFVPLLLREGPFGWSWTWAMRVLCNNADGGHPDWLADHLRPAFEKSRLKPLTAEVLQILREHCALLFRCMYSISGENALLDEDLGRILYCDVFDLF